MSDQPGWVPPSWDPTQRGGEQPPAGPPPAGPPPGYLPPAAAPPPYPAPPPPGYAAYGPGSASGYGYQAPKPGIIPLRPLGVGEILDGAVSVIRTHWKIMIGLSLVVVSVTGLIQFVLKVSLLRDLSTNGSFVSGSSDSFSSSPQFTSSDAGGLIGYLGSSALGWVATILLTGMFTVIVSQAVLGQRATLGEAWARVRPQVWRLIGLSVVVPICWAIGAVFCIIPGIFLYVALALSSPALVLERGQVFASMGRSMRLVRNSWWRTFGILLLTAVIGAVVAFVVSIPFLIVGGGSIFAFGGNGSSDTDFVLLQALTTVAGIVAGAVTYPFAASVTTLLYIDQRMRKEGLDIELMRAAGAAPPPQPQQFGQYGQPGQYGQYGQPPT